MFFFSILTLDFGVFRTVKKNAANQRNDTGWGVREIEKIFRISWNMRKKSLSEFNFSLLLWFDVFWATILRVDTARKKSERVVWIKC